MYFDCLFFNYDVKYNHGKDGFLSKKRFEQ